MKKYHSQNKGFTLVELMIAVAVLAILGAIAIPAYQQYITQSKRQSARSVLEQFPLLLESYRAENGQFPGVGTNTYNYIENDDGSIQSNTIITTAGLTEFSPKSPTAPGPIQFNYTLIINQAGTPSENASFTATGVREAVGITESGTYQ